MIIQVHWHQEVGSEMLISAPLVPMSNSFLCLKYFSGCSRRSCPEALIPVVPSVQDGVRTTKDETVSSLD